MKLLKICIKQISSTKFNLIIAMVKKCGGRCNLFEMPEMHTSLIHVRLVKIIKSIISNFKQSLVNPV